MYLVIECCEREITAIKPAETEDKAMTMANALLEDHLENIGYERDTEDEPYALYRARPGYGDTCAWSNLHDQNYDAFFIPLTDAVKEEMLRILTAELGTAPKEAGRPKA